jgi:hypothetical protein
MASVQPSDFSQFCDFVVKIRDAGADNITPEQSVEEFRLEQEKWRRWNEGNAVAQEQTRRGLYGPLDLDAMLARIEQRISARGDER